VNTNDIEAYLEIKSALSIPIAGGECLKNRYAFERFLTRRAVHIIQPDIGLCGGITEMYRIATMANTCNIQVNPHTWASQITVAATAHLVAALPPCPPAFQTRPYIHEPVMEFDQTPSGFRESICIAPLMPDDGFIKVPSSPGLGIEVNEEIVKEYCEEGGHTVCTQKA
jgi:D-galactarolactone cycloisomerase